jgi:hypothetical protein
MTTFPVDLDSIQMNFTSKTDSHPSTNVDGFDISIVADEVTAANAVVIESAANTTSSHKSSSDDEWAAFEAECTPPVASPSDEIRAAFKVCAVEAAKDARQRIGLIRFALYSEDRRLAAERFVADQKAAAERAAERAAKARIKRLAEIVAAEALRIAKVKEEAAKVAKAKREAHEMAVENLKECEANLAAAKASYDKCFNADRKARLHSEPDNVRSFLRRMLKNAGETVSYQLKSHKLAEEKLKLATSALSGEKAAAAPVVEVDEPLMISYERKCRYRCCKRIGKGCFLNHTYSGKVSVNAFPRDICEGERGSDVRCTDLKCRKDHMEGHEEILRRLCPIAPVDVPVAPVEKPVNVVDSVATEEVTLQWINLEAKCPDGEACPKIGKDCGLNHFTPLGRYRSGSLPDTVCLREKGLTDRCRNVNCKADHVSGRVKFLEKQREMPIHLEAMCDQGSTCPGRGTICGLNHICGMDAFYPSDSRPEGLCNFEISLVKRCYKPSCKFDHFRGRSKWLAGRKSKAAAVETPRKVVAPAAAVETPRRVVAPAAAVETPNEVVAPAAAVETPNEVVAPAAAVETPNEVVAPAAVVETPNEVVAPAAVVETPNEVVAPAAVQKGAAQGQRRGGQRPPRKSVLSVEGVAPAAPVVVAPAAPVAPMRCLNLEPKCLDGERCLKIGKGCGLTHFTPLLRYLETDLPDTVCSREKGFADRCRNSSCRADHICGRVKFLAKLREIPIHLEKVCGEGIRCARRGLGCGLNHICSETMFITGRSRPEGLCKFDTSLEQRCNNPTCKFDHFSGRSSWLTKTRRQGAPCAPRAGGFPTGGGACA